MDVWSIYKFRFIFKYSDFLFMLEKQRKVKESETKSVHQARNMTLNLCFLLRSTLLALSPCILLLIIILPREVHTILIMREKSKKRFVLLIWSVIIIIRACIKCSAREFATSFVSLVLCPLPLAYTCVLFLLSLQLTERERERENNCATTKSNKLLLLLLVFIIMINARQTSGCHKQNHLTSFCKISFC